jgi:hypothetical protein
LRRLKDLSLKCLQTWFEGLHFSHVWMERREKQGSILKVEIEEDNIEMEVVESLGEDRSLQFEG